jgi:predicted  nucleic acid-binding Zn-ribbon protein
MWKQLFDLAKKIAFLAQDTQKNKADIKDLQHQMEELTETVRQMAHNIQRDRENEAHEREKLLLRLEVALLRSEHRTLTGRSEPGFLLEGEDEPLPPNP